MRSARIERTTKEASVLVDLNVDGTGVTEVGTGIPFFNHMVSSLARHALFDLTLTAEGDLEVDAHHTVEDVSIVLGQALAVALGDRSGVSRFGDSLIPLDEALVQCAVDLSGRPYCVHSGEPAGMELVVIGGAYSGSLTRHVFESLSAHAALALHVRVLAGRDPHHIVEAQYKAVGRALRAAAAIDPREVGVPSVKGIL